MLKFCKTNKPRHSEAKGVDDYFEGALPQLEERAHGLLGTLPRAGEVPREFHRLIERCRDLLNENLNDIHELKNPEFRLPELRRERLREYRRVSKQLSQIENMGVAALVRREHEEDLWLNRLTFAIIQEINYPLLPPVVSGLSSSYFQYNFGLDLLSVPLREGSQLLHLADLYHELAHPLFRHENHRDERVAPLQVGLLTALLEVEEHFKAHANSLERRQATLRQQFNIQVWRKNWGRSWAEELFCDLYAVYSLGPAYAWSHLHLCAKTERLPYQGAPTHPADAARMDVLLYALELIGFDAELEQLRSKWKEFLDLSQPQLDAIYRHCYPQQLLQTLAQHAYEGVVASKSIVATPSSLVGFGGTLNQAWTIFWQYPERYESWEKDVIANIKRTV